MSQQHIRLSKDSFKFSAAHFLIFDSKRAEKLHGHNYYVSVTCEVIPKNNGIQCDFATLKSIIRSELTKYDERVILPQKHPEIRTKIEGNNLELSFRDRFYSFPREEVLLLPISNTSVEELSRMISENLTKEFTPLGITHVTVEVEETRGQTGTSRTT